MDGIKESVNWDYVKVKMAKEENEAKKELEKSKEKWVKNSAGVLDMVHHAIPKIFGTVSFAIYETINISAAADLLSTHFLKK